MQAKRTVLVVEDEPLIAMEFEDTLIEAGFDVLIASNLTEALRIVVDRHLDMAVLDFKLGVENSIDVGYALRNKRVPFLVCTASQEFREVGAEVFGSVAWLPKPFTDAQIMKAISAVLSAPPEATRQSA